MTGEHDETVQEPMQPGGGLVGRVLASRYRIESRLGRGGMATVYLATDLRLERHVVVKVPHESLIETPGFLERFQREVRSLTRVEHPNVVQVHDVGEEDGLPFAVVQLLRGGNLGERLAQVRRQTPQQVAEWLPHVARALDSIHASGFVHRDVKPDNILFDEHDNVYVSDFGIATALPDPTRETQTQLTQVGGFVGSPAYAPPEALDRELSPAYDQYSLGISVYEALCGRKPFEAKTAQGLVRAKATGDPARVPRDVALPRAASAALGRALARDPGERFGSCRDFARAFGEGLERRPRRWVPAAAATLVAAAGLWAWTTRLAEGPRTAAPPGLTGEPAAPQAPADTSAPDASPADTSAPDASPADTSAPDVPQADTSGPAVPPADTGAPAAPEPPPPPFRPGSTSAEIRVALELCARYASDCDPAWYASEKLREADIAPVELDAHEVTNAEFAAFVEKTSYLTTAERRGYSYDGPLRVSGPSWRRPAGAGSSHADHPRHPVVHVSAADAEAYCASLGKRLPSEDEWELATRGRDRRVFPWGNEWDEARSIWHETPDSGLAPVGSRPSGATPEGLQDLAGNVWEWTATSEGDQRILKGGSWRETNPANLRAAARLTDDPDATNSDIGFRCATDRK